MTLGDLGAHSCRLVWDELAPIGYGIDAPNRVRTLNGMFQGHLGSGKMIGELTVEPIGPIMLGVTLVVQT